MSTPDTSERPRLLVVEDEEHLATGLKLNLELEGYAVDLARTARDAREHLVRQRSYAAIVLDVMLPDLDGISLCRRLRESGNYTPVVMLTARSSAEDRIAGLEAGADDYVVKPFDLHELLARIQSMLRRRAWDRSVVHAPPNTEAALRFGGRVQVDFERHHVFVEDEQIHLTQLELDLLRYFAEHPERVIPRTELLDKVWKLRHEGQSRTVDNFVMRLRSHFERDPSSPVHFLSVRGAGYRFVPEPRGAGETASRKQ